MCGPQLEEFPGLSEGRRAALDRGVLQSPDAPALAFAPRVPSPDTSRGGVSADLEEPSMGTEKGPSTGLS